MELVYLLLTFAIVIISVIYLIWRKKLSYWAERGVVHEKPYLLYGNLREVGRTQTICQPFRDFYNKYKGTTPFGGFYFSLRRAAVVFDLELAKNVLIKDFANFANRGNYYNERDDPISAHLFNLDGAKWRAMRAKLSPTFTSGKMKFMFPTLVEVAEKFVALMRELTVTETDENGAEKEVGVEIKELLARFTTDVIGSCAFGLECNSLKDPQAKFRVMGKKIFTVRPHGRFIFALMQAFPNLARKLHIKATLPDVSDFFRKVVRETVEYRERENVQRNDFMNLLIELKNRDDSEGLTIEEITAQAFVFFLAGFETSSSTMGFSLYELAVNQGIQDKARAEIYEMLERYDGKFTYEGVRELKYLQQILHETLRMYSIAPILVRKTISDYQVPNSKQVIEKDILVVIPVDAIHHDPDIYPNPDVFDPEHFAPEAVAKRNTMSWLPFGEGQRNCIGLRFGEMQTMVGLAMLLKHFRFSPGKETQIPIKIKISSFILASEDIILKVEALQLK